MQRTADLSFFLSFFACVRFVGHMLCGANCTFYLLVHHPQRLFAMYVCGLYKHLQCSTLVPIIHETVKAWASNFQCMQRLHTL